MKKKIIITIILILLLIGGIIISIPWLFSQQYNSMGVSHFLVITIDHTVPKTYIGKLDNHKVYIEELNINETNFRNVNAENVSVKEAIDKKLVSIKEWKKYAWYKIKNKKKEILRYENYEIVITKNECIIRPISKTKSLDYDCDGVKTRTTLKKGNTFECKLLSKDYTFKIKDIKKNYLIITVSDYGLTKVKKDNTISLISKDKEFKIEKNKKVELTTQSTDYNNSIIIELN